MTGRVQFSVAVCTYNRARSLRRLLASLENCVAGFESTWELLIIDNNSDDETREAVRQFEQRLPIRYFQETKQGHSHSRNRATQEFTGDWLIFTDDDVQVDENWLSAYRNGVQKYQSAEYFGGKIVPCYENGRPGWLVDERLALISGLIVLYDLGDLTRPYTGDDMHPYGANFSIHRRLIERIGTFRTDLGVVGNVPGRGDEAEYFQRVRAGSSLGVYLHDAVCYHYNDPKRFSLRYLYNYGRQKGIAECRMKRGDCRNMPRQAPLLTIIKGLYQLVKGRPDRFRQNVINLGIERGIRLVDRG